MKRLPIVVCVLCLCTGLALADGAAAAAGSVCTAAAVATSQQQGGAPAVLPDWALEGGFSQGESKARVTDPDCPIPGCYPPTVCTDPPGVPGCRVSTCSGTVDTGITQCVVPGGQHVTCNLGKTIHYDTCSCVSNCSLGAGNCSNKTGIANVRCQ